DGEEPVPRHLECERACDLVVYGVALDVACGAELGILCAAVRCLDRVAEVEVRRPPTGVTEQERALFRMRTRRRCGIGHRATLMATHAEVVGGVPGVYGVAELMWI